VRYRGLKLAGGDSGTHYRVEEAKGVLFLDSLRRRLGDDRFFPLMKDFFAANATKAITAEAFLQKAGVAFEFSEPEDGPAYVASDISRRLASAVLVYGTVREAGANRYAAEQMQSRFLDQYESAVPIYKDFEASDDQMGKRDVIFVGRPETNSALAAWAERLGLDYRGGVFRVAGGAHASEREALVWATKNPLDPSHMVLVIAGNDALRTVKTAQGGRWGSNQYSVYDAGRLTGSGFLK